MSTAFATSINTKKSIPIPKYTTYYSDGFGRDTYILSNNGGLLEKLRKENSKDKLDINPQVRYYNTRRNVAPLKYHSDGSGRDSYVLHESGGLEKEHKSLKSYQLKDFLRNTQSGKFNFSCDPVREGTHSKTLYLSRGQLMQENQIKSLEKNLADRLYYNEQYKFLSNKSQKRQTKYHLFLRQYENENSVCSAKARNLPNIALEVKERKINTAINNKNNLWTFYNSKMKIKNKIKEENQEKAEHNQKYHSKNLIMLTKNMSKVKNYDEYQFPKSERENFRILESPHYPIK